MVSLFPMKPPVEGSEYEYLVQSEGFDGSKREDSKILKSFKSAERQLIIVAEISWNRRICILTIINLIILIVSLGCFVASLSVYWQISRHSCSGDQATNSIARSTTFYCKNMK